MKYEISLYQNQGFGVDRHTTSKRAAMREAVDLQGSAKAGDSSAHIIVYALGNGPEPKPIAKWGQTCGGRWYRACLALTFAVALTASGFSQSLKPVTMPKPPADTRKPLTVQPVHLGAVPKPVAGPKPQPVTLRHAVRSVAVVASTTKPKP